MNLNELFLPCYELGARIHSDSWGDSERSYRLETYQIDVISNCFIEALTPSQAVAYYSSTNDPCLNADGHLLPASPVKDHAESTVVKDIDGEGAWDDPSVTNQHGIADLGADEWVDNDLDAESFLALALMDLDAESGSQKVAWSSVAGRHYAVLHTTNLVEDAWLPLATNLPAHPPQNVYTASLEQTLGCYLIRVER